LVTACASSRTRTTTRSSFGRWPHKVISAVLRALPLRRSMCSPLRTTSCSSRRPASGRARSTSSRWSTRRCSWEGIADALAAIDDHARASAASFRSRRRAGAIAQTVAIVERRHGEHGIASMGGRAELLARAIECASQGLVPREAAGVVGASILAAIARAS
jgi:hypothetical protein